MNWVEGAIVFAAAFVVTFATVPLSRRVAIALGAIDYPNGRRINIKPTPRCGGIAMFLGLHAAILTVAIGVRFFGWQLNDLYVVSGINYLVAYVGIVFIFCLGLVDDVTQLSAWAKFFGQVVAAIIVVMAGVSIGIVRMPITGEYIDLGWFNYPISVLYLVAFVNIINLIDGLDGLASGIVAIMSGCLLYLVVIRGNMTMAFVCIALIAVCVAFLRYNFHPASIFMGDSGAMMLGMVLGMIAIAGVTRAQSFVLLVVPIAIAGVPVLDTLSAIVRRLRGHQSIGMGDTDHIHHRLMRSKLGYVRAVLLLWACTAVLAVISCVITRFSGPVRWCVFAVLLVVVFVIIWRFGLFRPVLMHHYNRRGKTGPRMPHTEADANAFGAGVGAAAAADGLVAAGGDGVGAGGGGGVGDDGSGDVCAGSGDGVSVGRGAGVGDSVGDSSGDGAQAG